MGIHYALDRRLGPRPTSQPDCEFHLGKIEWYRNTGTLTSPKLAAAQPIEVTWKAKPPKPAWNWWNPEPSHLVTQWRTTPVVVDLNVDGLNDLVMLDHEGFLAFFERTRTSDEQLQLQPGKRIFVDESGQPVQLNKKTAGGSGRSRGWANLPPGKNYEVEMTG